MTRLTGTRSTTRGARPRGGVPVAVDRAIYLVHRPTRTYCFLRRNPDWRSLDAEVNHRNKRSLWGYLRLFRNGRSTVFTPGRTVVTR